MKAYIKEFEVYLKETKKSSSNTLESYLRDVSQFASYCDGLRLRSTANIRNEQIAEYIDELHKSGKSTATVTRVLASLRCYYTFLCSMGLCKDNPVTGIKAGKNVRKLPEILTAREVTLLLSQPDCSELKGCRDKAMLEMLYATGIKVSELINIKVTDINLQIGILHLHTEKSERIIPMYPEAIKALQNYCTNVRNVVVIDSDTHELFTNMNGQPMTRQGLWKIIKYYA